MDEIITKTVMEVQRLAGECLNVSREMEKNKANERGLNKIILIWRDLRKLAEEIRTKSGMER